MRLIRQLVEFLRLILKGEIHGKTMVELDEFLSEVSGIPLPLLEQTDPTTLFALLDRIDDPNRRGIISVILLQKAKTSAEPRMKTLWEDIGNRLLQGISRSQILTELKPLIRELEGFSINPEKDSP
jgi:hypothetical protein